MVDRIAANFSLNVGRRQVTKARAPNVLIGLIFIYWLTYEWVIFFYPIDYGGALLGYLTNLIKLIIPPVLLLLVGLPTFGSSADQRARRAMDFYIVLFILFIFWAIVPTTLSDTGSVVEVFKLVPRFLFFLAVLSIFAQYPSAFSQVAILIVGVVLLAVAQYFGAYALGVEHSRGPGAAPGLAGPLGLLGNVNSTMSFVNVPFPIIRLTGFWNEPSNASGVAFASFFLSRYLFKLRRDDFWRYCSYVCLVAGLLCFSNAGYVAFGFAILVGMFVRQRMSAERRLAHFLLSAGIMLTLIAVGLLGRGYVIENAPDNDLLRAVVGVREAEYSGIDEIYGGRIGLAEQTIYMTLDDPFGVGLQIIGSQGADGPAGAPLLWLFLTGIIGLAILLGREAVILQLAWKTINLAPNSIYIVQAWVVILVQQVSYGSWMNANYLVMVAAVFSFALRMARVKFNGET